MARPANFSTKTLVIVFFVSMLVGVGGGFLIGRRHSPPTPALDLHVIDSLKFENMKLQDSLFQVKDKIVTITKDQIRYRTKYDTIKVSMDAEEIRDNLRAIVKQPINE